MPLEAEQPEHSPNWTFRIFVIMAVLLFLSSLLWLIWAMVKFGPTSDDDVLKGLLNDDMFAAGDILITRRNSDCRSSGSAKGNITAALYDTFTEANAGPEPDPVKLLSFNLRQRVVDASQSPDSWYTQERIPVASISSVGIYGRDALVCIDLFKKQAASYFVKLHRTTATRWDVKEEILVWEEELPEKPEEIPKLLIPEVR